MTLLNLVMLQMNCPQHMMEGIGGFGMGLMMIFWLLVLGLLGTLIWYLIQRGKQSSEESPGESSIEILKKRYARGEIDEDTYHRMKKEITD